MKLNLNKNSLFAILLRSSWWISAAIALGLFLVARLFLPPAFAAFAALPFGAIAVYVAWKQLRAPNAERVAAMLAVLRAMSWDEFSAALEAAFRRDGYEVTPLAGRPADYELRRAGRVALVACKRWKAMRTGIEPLRELHAAREARDANDCIYVSAGEITDTARKFAAEKRIDLLCEAELATKVGSGRS